MQMIDAETVHRLLPYKMLIKELKEMHKKKIPEGDIVYTKDPSGADNMFVTMPGWLSGKLIVVKMVGVFPSNRDRDPPIGSVIISSTMPIFFKSLAPTFIASAASGALADSRQTIEAHASGDATEYVPYSKIEIWSPTPRAKAPPDPPSPVITTRILVFRVDITARFLAIASL